MGRVEELRGEERGGRGRGGKDARTLCLTVPIHIIDPRAHIRVLVVRDVINLVLFSAITKAERESAREATRVEGRT